mgnify:FL=1
MPGVDKTSHKKLNNQQISNRAKNNGAVADTGKKQRTNKQVDLNPLAPYRGVFRRLVTIYKHVLGLLLGAVVARSNSLSPEKRKFFRSFWTRFSARLIKPFLKKSVRNETFAVQLRKRLEMLGSTYIKLGQIVAIREDLLPQEITDELKNLLDRLPEVPFETIKHIIEESLEMPLDVVVKSIDSNSLGSASIAQVHKAETHSGEKVVFKVIKPGIRDSILTDIQILKMVSGFLQWLIPRYQPKMIIDEFNSYTEKEVDLTYEADHAELFAANFKDDDNVVFPKIYRDLSSKNVLCMSLLDGDKPADASVQQLSEFERNQLVEAGAGAIIKMLYKHGFFHADLHPGNLIILPDSKVGFIDLGMVGRFEDKTRRFMLYYFYALVNGNEESATKYLFDIAKVGENGNPKRFKREVTDLMRRYRIYSARGEFSLGELVLESIRIGGKYRIFFPVEMTLMVKALVTFEGVGLMIDPNMDVPAISQKHISRIFRNEYNPLRLGRQLLQGAPEVVDALINMPKLLSDSARYLDETLNDQSPNNPLEGLRSGILASACLISAVLAIIQGANPFIWIFLLIVGGALYLFGN